MSLELKSYIEREQIRVIRMDGSHWTSSHQLSLLVSLLDQSSSLRLICFSSEFVLVATNLGDPSVHQDIISSFGLSEGIVGDDLHVLPSLRHLLYDA